MQRLCWLLASLSIAASACIGEESSFAAATAAEEAAQSALIGDLRRWDTDSVRELARTIERLPEAVAVEAVWTLSSAPRRLDTTHALAAALRSPSPRVRSLAADALVALGDANTKRMLRGLLATENDPEVIRHIVIALAMQPKNQSVRNMMDIMFETGLKSPATETAAEQLRRLTRARLSDNAADWRDWWLDNETSYP